MFKGGYIYILNNKHRTTLYIGVSSDIIGRVYDHKDHRYKYSFTDKYNVEYLVYFETLDGIEEAIAREKEIKKWRREKKDALINSMNPEWKDLYDDVVVLFL
ncbi:MAG: GIY-YIG nuclease family protein [Taibaiella sp.]|nr:GIY-YIG nuclease family protein [Taibaiella sp.]